jgi:predicted  nucleic acid-binding Zn-ribbon protein
LTVVENIEQLRSLQSIDDGIKAMETELEQLPKNLEAAREDFNAVEGKTKVAEEALEAIRKRRRSLEQEISDADESVIKYENDKIKVKTNTEFRALNTQIDQQKEIKSGLEDQVLLSYDEEEEAEELSKKLEEELAMVSRSVESREEELRIRGEEDRKRLLELQAQRTGLIEKMAPRILSRYEMIRGRKGGIAVVNVRRSACGGCHTQQPPQKVNEIRKQDALHNCDFCGRFLVWGVDEAVAT